MHQEIKDRIIHLLQEIVERTHSISQPTRPEIDIEIDIAMDDIRQLYREFDLLRRIQPTTATKMPPSDAAEVVAHTQHTKPEQVAIDLVPASIVVDEVPLPKIAEQPAVSKAPGPAPEPLEEPQAGKEFVAGKPTPIQEIHGINPESVLVKPETAKPADLPHNGNRGVVDLFTQEAPRSVGENFAREDNSLHKRIVAQKEDRSIGTRLQMTPVANLKDAIGVNEKFLFINELFGGNIQVYNEAIARLNSFGNMQQAFDFLNELSDSLAWDQNRSGQAIEKMANFVQRRYIDRK